MTTGHFSAARLSTASSTPGTPWPPASGSSFARRARARRRRRRPLRQTGRRAWWRRGRKRFACGEARDGEAGPRDVVVFVANRLDMHAVRARGIRTCASEPVDECGNAGVHAWKPCARSPDAQGHDPDLHDVFVRPEHVERPAAVALTAVAPAGAHVFEKLLAGLAASNAARHAGMGTTGKST